MLLQDRLRQELLNENRYMEMDLPTIRQTGKLLFDDARAISLYGRMPDEYYRLGCRILGRTAVEGCFDPHATCIAAAAQHVMDDLFCGVTPVVVDLFLGSGNLLFHIANRCRAKHAIGFEEIRQIKRCAEKNFKLVGFNANIVGGCYAGLLDTELHQHPDRPAIVIIDPPWGKNGFSFAAGLDLRRTEPPVVEVLDVVREKLHARPVITIIKTYERMAVDSLEAILVSHQVHAQGITNGCAKVGRGVGYVICEHSGNRAVR